MARKEAGSLNPSDPEPMPPDPLEQAAKAAGYDTDDPGLYSLDGLKGGIRCPHCHCAHHSVIDTRQSEVKQGQEAREYIRRWRKCRHCGCTFPTREVVEPEISQEIKSPAQAKKVSKKIAETMTNVLPVDPSKLPTLPNPYVK